MSSKILFIARHGETDYNKNKLLQGRGIDAPLNSTGILQAGLLADYLNNYPIECVVSSSLKRSCQTAEVLARRIGINVIREKNLDEMDFGDLEGLKFSAVGDQLDSIQQKWANGNTEYKMPGGESPAEVYKRVSESMNGILNENNHTCYAFILHGRLIRILLSEWLGYGLKNMQKINHSNGAVNKLVLNESQDIIVKYLNKTDHLEQYTT